MSKYIVIYREPESPIHIYEVDEDQLLELLSNWQTEIVQSRTAYGLPNAELSFVRPEDVNPAKEIGQGKDASIWPSWKALVIQNGEVVIPKPATVTSTYQIED